MQQIKQLQHWWQTLQSRERQMLTVAMIVIVIFVLYGLVWQSLIANKTQLSKDVASKRELLVWMQQSSQQILLSQSAGPKQSTAAGNRLAIIERSLKLGKMKDIKRELSQVDVDTIRVIFEEVAFNDMHLWLVRLWEQNGLYVDTMRMQRLEQDGMVKVAMTLK